MEQKLLILVLNIITLLSVSLKAQPIYSESFNFPNQGVWADADGNLISNFDLVDWTLSYAGCEFSDENDYAKTVSTSGGRFEVLDSDGEVTWFSPTIDISSFAAFSISLTASETGSSTAADKKYVIAAYLLDGIYHSFSTDSAATGNWGSKTLATGPHKGNSLQIVIKMNSSYANDKVIIDEIMVEAVDPQANDPDQLVFLPFAGTIVGNAPFSISAQVYNKANQAITNTEYRLQLSSAQLNISSPTFNQGVYTWQCSAKQTGKVSISLGTSDFDSPSTQAEIQIIDPEKVIIHEPFENAPSANWITNSHWEWSATLPISGNQSLKHVSQPENGKSSITLNVNTINLNEALHVFSFKLKNGNWDPSSSNLFYVTLSDSTRENGYMIGVNASGTTDLVSLWKMSEGKATELIAQTAFDWNENTTGQIDVSRDNKGNWQLTGSNLGRSETYSAAGFDNTFKLISYIELHFAYTSTRSGQLWFDDLLLARENTPPYLTRTAIDEQGVIWLYFSEPVSSQTLNNSNIKLTNRQGEQYNYQLIANQQSFTDSLGIFPLEVDVIDLEITLNNLSDTEGAIAQTMTEMVEYLLPAAPFDVVINEIMADPNPPVGLPNSEYIELYNRSNKHISLQGWRIWHRTTSRVLPQVELPPNGFLVLCHPNDTAALAPFARVTPVTSFPSLLNAGALLRLTDNSGRTIDSINYAVTWYGNTAKASGGWSLERIDPDRHCGQSQNWRASENELGGTPGIANSVKAPNPDNTSPTILQVNTISTRQIEIVFSEPPTAGSVLQTSNYTISNGLSADSILFAQGTSIANMYLKGTIEVNTPYSIQAKQISDECGNLATELSSSFSITLLSAGSILISEILFNPIPYGSDFVEIHNPGPLPIDVSKLWIATRDDSLKLKSISVFSKQSLYIEAGEYLAFTRDVDHQLSQYLPLYPERILQIASLPAFADDKGMAVLLNDSLEIIDEMSYTEKMHNALLNNREGVSLERVSFKKPASDSQNWQSASSLSAYATPGYKNSNTENATGTRNSISIEPEVVSMDNDGYNDELIITFETTQPGYMANVAIFDSAGKLVKRLSNNTLVGNTETMTFGVTNNELPLRTGTYIVWAELVHQSGTREVVKKAFYLSR